MERIQQIINYVMIMSVLSHFFCCVLPTFSSLVGLGASFGLISSQLAFVGWFHDHQQELLTFSGIVLAISALAQFIGWRIDCHNTGCEHGACEPKKKRSSLIFGIAVTLFVINLVVFQFHGHLHTH